MSEKVLRAAWALVQEMDRATDKGLPQEIASVIKLHTRLSVILALLIGWIPALGGVAASIISAVLIWSMYLRINNAIGLKPEKSIFSTLLSGIATNLLAYGIMLIFLEIISLIPFLGTFGVPIAISLALYFLLTASGVAYLKILTNIFKTKSDPTLFSFADLKIHAKAAIDHEDVKVIIGDAKSAFSKASGLTNTTPPTPIGQCMSEMRDPALPVATPNLLDELQKLAQMKDQGILSAEEFQAAKTRLIGA